MLGQDLSVGGAGELSTAIGVKDKSLRGATMTDGHAQGGNDQCGIEDLAHGPTDDSPGEDIKDRDEIQPALTSEDCGGIADPDLIGPSNGEVPQSVRRDGSAVTTVGGGRSIFGTLPGKDALGPHQSRDAIAPSRAAQHLCQPRAAVSLTTESKFLADARS